MTIAPIRFVEFPKFTPILSPLTMITAGVNGGKTFQARNNFKWNFTPEEMALFKEEADRENNPSLNNQFRVKGTKKIPVIRDTLPFPNFAFWYYRFFNGYRSPHDFAMVEYWKKAIKLVGDILDTRGPSEAHSIEVDPEYSQLFLELGWDRQVEWNGGFTVINSISEELIFSSSVIVNGGNVTPIACIDGTVTVPFSLELVNPGCLVKHSLLEIFVENQGNLDYTLTLNTIKLKRVIATKNTFTVVSNEITNTSLTGVIVFKNPNCESIRGTMGIKQSWSLKYGCFSDKHTPSSFEV